MRRAKRPLCARVQAALASHSGNRPLRCRILQLDALLRKDGLWDPDRASILKDQISNRQDDLEALYRIQGLLLEEYC